MTREARRERYELYSREYDQGRVTYNDIYFQQKSLWPVFFLFLPGSWQNWLVQTWLYRYSQNWGLTNKRNEVARSECQ